MRYLVHYSIGGAGVSSLASLGLEFDEDGRLELDTTAFATATNTDAKADDVLSFLGSASSGFLRHALDTLNGLTDETDGLFEAQTTSLGEEIDRIDDQIAAEQGRIDLMEENLRERMAAADAVIAAMEQQVSFMIALFEQMQLNAERY
jgi:flagellar capping protein FliD